MDVHARQIERIIVGVEHGHAVFSLPITVTDDFGRFICAIVGAGFVEDANHPHQAHLLGLPGCAGLIEQFAGKGHFFAGHGVFHQVDGHVGQVTAIPFGLDGNAITC